ncbi:chemotaxis protein CheA, partial [Thioalkalivibrio sp. XN279]|uniref:chemotaxis protein CheA n=1 Tax=Thioalkalivibrio sp. XN279 TaxID=2714953 RepID=UPI00140D967D
APAAPEPTLRVDTARLDTLMNLVGELVLVRNRLVALKMRGGGEAAETAVSGLDLITSELQAAVMRLRMQPVRKVFGRFPRVARDTARTLGKEVDLELHGEDTELDKNLVEMLADPLVHLVRNAVDHGIETPEERVALGKPRAGKVELSAAQEGNAIVIAISDDGKGMDPEVLRRKAVEKGLHSADAAQRLSDAEAWDLIFMPGFSTRAEVSDVSGRGVGMDVVRTAIGRLNGSVVIDSRVGIGTTIEIRLPLTLAIFPTLLVSVGGLRYALPLAGVRELLELDTCRTRRVEGREVVMVRDETMPLHRMAEWFLPGHESARPSHAVVVDLGAGEFAALAADALLGQEDVVIKPLGSVLDGLPGFSGATITGDGSIALILDPRGLVSRHAPVAPERLAS